MTIGFVGLGIMGESMCGRILTAGGHQTLVYDTKRNLIDKLVARGAAGAGSVAEVGRRSSHIIIMVPNSEQVTAVVDELIPTIAKDTIIIDMSTIAPAVSVALAKRVAAAGGVMIDAPVVKSKAAAVSGDLGILVGGDEKTFQAVLPLLRCMGKNIIRMGDNGAGLTMKLCHNMLVANIQNGVNEMLVLAQSCGLSLDETVKAIGYGGGQNFYLDSKAATLKARDFSPKFPLRHMHKDLTLAAGLAQARGVTLAALDRIRDLYEEGMAMNLGGEDFSAALKVVEQDRKSVV
jgi:3-hydroxyisobutyrate dehydrogenase-like beta-hydroxyacid dehydrogenase